MKESFGSCYFVLLLFQLVILIVLPFIVYYLTLEYIMKKVKKTILAKFFGSFLIGTTRTYGGQRSTYYHVDTDRALLASFVVGLPVMLIVAPIAIVVTILVAVFMLYRIICTFAIRYICCC